MSMGIMGIGAQFINAAGRGGKKAGDNQLSFIGSTADPTIYQLSCRGEIQIVSTKNGEQVSANYSNLSDTEISIQADANTEVVISGNVIKIQFAYQTYMWEGYVSLNQIITENCKSLSVLHVGGNEGLASLDLSQNTALTNLDCSSCSGLTSIDLSKNTALAVINCSDCSKLTSLDLSKNTALTDLSCGFCTGLTSLDLSKNTALAVINCSGCSGLTSLDLSKNTALKVIGCNGCTGLTSLDLSIHTALTSLSCSGSGLTSLDLSQNTALTNLSCSSCSGLTSLDLSQNTALIEFNCGSCSGLTSLDLSQNTALTNLSCSNCKNLISISYPATNENVSTAVAGAITAANAADGTVYTDSAAAYYSTIATAATTKGWTIEQIPA